LIFGLIGIFHIMLLYKKVENSNFSVGYLAAKMGNIGGFAQPNLILPLSLMNFNFYVD